MKRRLMLIIVLLVFIFLALFLYWSLDKKVSKNPIKVGILHSLSGTMAISEASVVNATLLAIEEINAQGGLLGRKIKPIVADGKSDWPTFAKEAERLITQEEVSVVFGCWTSASRKTVKPIFEEYDHLLFYPLQYEGLEASPNIIYTGAAPNQQIIPAVKWSFDNIGKRFFLVGSDYIFPRSANEIIKEQISRLGGDVVGEMYVPLGETNFKDVQKKIIQSRPDIIMNTINGDSNIAFFNALYHHEVNITSNKIPIMSFSIAENEIQTFIDKIKKEHKETDAHDFEHHIAGNYAAWNYFQSINTKDNRKFVQHFKARYGSNSVTDDPMEAAYFGVYLWAGAVRKAGTEKTKDVRMALGEESFIAPEGLVYIDPDNNHTWKTIRIGKIRVDGQFDIVWSSEKPIRPIPYPSYRSQREWKNFLNGLYTGWGNSWAKPVK